MRACVFCSAPYMPGRRGQEFCSPICGTRFRGLDQTTRPGVAVTCKHCLCGFEARTNNAMFCSQACRSAYPVRNEVRSCLGCGETFTPRGKKQIYCGYKCSQPAFAALAKSKATIATCKQCSVVFNPKHYRYITFCSRECYFTAKKAEPKIEFTPVWPRNCHVCDSVFIATRSSLVVCSADCRKEKARADSLAAYRNMREAIPEVPQACLECGEHFLRKETDGSRSYCSGRCSGRVGRRTRRITERRRLEPIYFADIYDRDNGKCHICGLSASKTLKPPDYRAATLDHVHPISRHGEHSRDNVKIAHFLCNMLKSDRPLTKTIRAECASRILATPESVSA